MGTFSMVTNEKGFLMMLEVIAASIAILGSTIIWFCNKQKERIHEEYVRKEERYNSLIKTLAGFYVGSENKKDKDVFITEGNLCWLYCPDDVIQKLYNFLSKVEVGVRFSDEEKEMAVGQLMVAIRNDLISRKILKKSDLKPEDFKNLSAL